MLGDYQHKDICMRTCVQDSDVYVQYAGLSNPLKGRDSVYLEGWVRAAVFLGETLIWHVKAE